MVSENKPDFQNTLDDYERIWKVNFDRMVARDRKNMSREEFNSKYAGQADYGPDKVVPVVPTEMILEEAGFKRDVAGEDFDLICRAFSTIASIPNMGLLLTGSVGSGKTFAVTAVVKGGDLVRLTDKEDFLSLEPAIDEDTGRTVWQHIQSGRDVILDDLGNEPVKSCYGVKIDVVADFILKWYTEKHERGGKGRLYATTNLDAVQLTDRYGDRVTDRLFSMVCVVKLSGASKRRKPIVIK